MILWHEKQDQLVKPAAKKAREVSNMLVCGTNQPIVQTRLAV